MRPRSACVIGAGFAGLGAALELAREGVRVEIIEASDAPGGRAQWWEERGYRFDLGPTLLVMRDVLQRALGDEAFEALELRRLEPGYRVRWSNGDHLAVHSDIALMLAEFERFGESRARMLAYIAKAHDAYRDARVKILDRDHTILSFLGALLQPGKNHSWIAGNLRRLTERYARNPRIVQALTFQTLYLGTSPLRAPAMYAILPVEEIVGGVWYAAGGTRRLVETLLRECERYGVTLRLGTRAERVERTASGVRIEAGSERFEADALVVAADREPSLALFNGNAPRGRAPRYGHSAYVWYWGIEGTLPLDHHTISLPDDPWAAYAQLDAGQAPDEPMLYLCNPAATDPSCAPPGCTALLALAPVPNRALAPHFDEAALRDRALRAIERHTGPFRDRIVVERARGPEQFESELGLMHGAAFGPDHTLDQMGPFRPAIAHATMPNVVFAGSGTRPGSGVPMVLISGRLAARRLLDA
jgi:phytoene desaturase